MQNTQHIYYWLRHLKNKNKVITIVIVLHGFL